ncbi:MAG: hypothetical protein ACTSYM_05835 [Candidatus Baldrarchaeia archaeon]
MVNGAKNKDAKPTNKCIDVEGIWDGQSRLKVLIVGSRRFDLPEPIKYQNEANRISDFWKQFKEEEYKAIQLWILNNLPLKPTQHDHNKDERLRQKCYEIEEVRFTELKSGLKGIAIDYDDLFLALDYDYQHLMVKLLDIYDFVYPLTGWFWLRKPSDLRDERCKAIHKILEKRYGEGWKLILERVIAELENYIEIMNEEKPEFWRCPKCKVAYHVALAEKLKYRCPKCGKKLYPR